MTDSSESDSMNVVHLFKKKINSFFIVLGDNVVFLLYKSGRLSLNKPFWLESCV